MQVLEWSGTDADLLELARKGSPQFAARLYDRFHRDINRVVHRFLGPDADHDDLVHDAFVQVLRHIDQVREPDRLASWVVSITVHTVYRELKRRKLRRWFFGKKKVEPLEAVGETDLEGRRLLRGVYQVLDAMPATERRVFVLRYLDDRSMAEVAELCDCSLSTAKRSLARAEQRFETLAARYAPEIAARFVAGWGRGRP